MSASFARLRAALPVIVTAHAVKTLFALAILGGFGSALAGASEHGAPSAGPAWLIALGLRTLPQLAGAQWLVLLYLFAAPLLTQLVLAALARPGSLRAALHASRQRYAGALLQAVACHFALALIVLAGYSAAGHLPALVPHGALYEESARFACIALALFGVLFASTAFDLAAARLAIERTSFGSALRAGLRATCTRTLLLHAALFAASGGLYALGELLVRDVAWPALAVAAQQAFALSSSVARAQWLACALDAISLCESARTNQPKQAGSYRLV